MATDSDYSIVQTRSTNSLDSKTLELEYLHFVIYKLNYSLRYMYTSLFVCTRKLRECRIMVVW